MEVLMEDVIAAPAMRYRVVIQTSWARCEAAIRFLRFNLL